MNDRFDPAEIFVPLFGMIFVFGFPITAWIVFRWLAHRERMAMIQAGMVPPPGRGRNWAPPPGVAPAEVVRERVGRRGSCDEPYSPQVALRKGITLAFIGLALTIGLSFIGLHGDGWRPGPWLLGGLIPTFIGVAQVVIAVISGATLGPVQTAWDARFDPRMAPGAAAPPPVPPPGPTFDGPYTYRPGTTQELQRPYSPPERRP